MRKRSSTVNFLSDFSLNLCVCFKLRGEVCSVSLFSLEEMMAISIIIKNTSPQVIHGVHLEPAHIMRRRSLDQRLRVKIYYDVSVYK